VGRDHGMTGGTYDAVIFDIGGVILDWDPRHLYRSLIPDPDEMEWFLSEVCSDAWNAEQDRGRAFSEGVEEAVARHPGHRELIEAYWKRWPETLGGAIPGTSELIAEAAEAGIALFAITNFSAETYPAAVAGHEVLSRFQDVVVSGEVKMIKPDPAIFHYALDRFGLAPHQALFVDDKPANVASAERLGMGAVLFTGADDLRERMKRSGLL
jgi:2-haloacid dehalogenase